MELSVLPSIMEITNMEPRRVVELDDDDLFYAELREQILLLMADEDDEDLKSGKASTRQSPVGGRGLAATSETYFSWPENMEGSINEVPSWLLDLWKSGSGTGVFIPHIVKTRKKNKPRRRNNRGGRMYKPVA